ncbi:MFS transporter [bacterium]|nr:MFS transporter [bacterium]
MKPRFSAVAAAGFAAFLNIYAVQALLPTLCQAFSAPRAQVGLIISATTLAVALFSPLAGLLGARMRRRTKLTVALTGLTVCGMGAALAPDLQAMMAWRFAQGAFLPLLSSSIMTWIGEDCQENRVGHTMSIYVTWTVIGGVCGRLTAGVLGYHLGWRAAMVALAVLTGAAASVVLARVPDKIASNSTHTPWREMLGLLRSRQLRTALLTGFLILFCVVGVFSYITYYLSAAPFNLSSDRLGALFLVYLLGTIVTPWAGRMFHKIGYPLALRYASLLGLVGVLLTLHPYLGSVLVGMLFCSTSAFISQSAMSGYVSAHAPNQRSQALGLYLSAYYLGGCAAGFIPAWAWNLGAWPACALLFASAYLTCAGTLARRLG